MSIVDFNTQTEKLLSEAAVTAVPHAVIDVCTCAGKDWA